MMRTFPRRVLRTLLFASLLVTAVGHPVMAASVQVIDEAGKALVLDASKGLLLRLERPASTVFVADPEIADIQMKSPRLVYLLAKKPGQTTLYAVDGNERVLASRRITVNHNLSRLRDALKELVPGSAISARTVDSSIVLSGMASTPAEAEGARRLALAITKDPKNIVNNIAVTAPSQVHLRVRVAEVSRDVLKQFGINWDAVLTTGKFLVGIATGNPVTAAGAFLARNNDTSSLFGRFTSNKLDLNGLIDALDDEGMITVLAEPNLTAVSGKPANFLAGGEFPILVPGDDNRVTVAFKQFGVSLAFTPTILGSDRIGLHVNPEVSQLSTAGAVEISGFSIPALTTRRAETTVELGNGQSFAIAGLLQNNMNHDITKFPGLGDLPVLGTLFRSDRYQRNESELVIIVTPYIVRPVSAARLAAPTDGLVQPSDTDRILHGRMYRPTLQRGPKTPAIGGTHGSAAPLGFALD
jgi:pilus assembly protein CpaC